ncbi:N-acetylglucosaminyldiphosphoundecaprenol N-acetyl-beta-D-mannosaminyltransferase [Clostridium acidisoli DSM 12555]|uniref:N-acetylglucosaminyldiphosphoundecaprenol N-acetyl-beta-D-mannosaminyltransferase n=1 Tax=Clostridium acidisoli DSM 12555 TaxID=1121291 RepID=A0A1W1XH13_9CLOT|nr:WecB/TagA/CpsF family glycosyltransferase [Clostridium acidisoli]SMC23240.1 N-acetylglucosaminyldiphosphoundecaprenol N-acetyl-beta-D-mannosaminyltransferase [Clostridium acidisoli DSM 12555]
MNEVEMLNVRFDNVDMQECIKVIDYMINDRTKFKYVVTPNVDHVMKVNNDPSFKKIYKEADLILVDGQPLVWLSKLVGKPLKEKVSGSDLFPRLCEHAASKEYKVFFLGGLEGVADKAAENLKQQFKNLNVVGTYCPPFGFENDENENNKIIKKILAANPDILFVGVGAPKQETWIYNNRDKYKVPVSLGVGASFDFIAGTIKRSPKWMQKCCLEWFYRFCKEPKRLFRRYFIEDSIFIVIAIKEIYRSIVKRC